MSPGPLEPLNPLGGLRVLEASFYVPGPFCSLVLASLGAEVIKVEPPKGGDPMRELDAVAFSRLNAGKKSVCLELKAAPGAASFRRLVRTADVLVEGFRPGVMEGLGLGERALREERPELVYASISGYGQSGPLRSRAGHDVNYMALAGALGGTRAPLAVPFADFAAGGLYAALGILAALMQRTRAGGLGGHLDVAMHEGLLSFLLLSGGAAEQRLSGRFADYGIYQASDGAVSVGALEEKFWRRLCVALERTDLEGRQSDPEAREEIAGAIRGRPRAEWETVFRDADACVEPLLDAREALEHPQARHRRGDGSPGFQLPFGVGATPLGPAPALGAHTEAVLGELGSAPEGPSPC